MKAHKLTFGVMIMMALLAVPAVAQQHDSGSVSVEIAGAYWTESEEGGVALGIGYFFADQWEVSLRGDVIFFEDDEVFLALIGLTYVFETSSSVSPYFGIQVGGAFADNEDEFVFGALAGLEIGLGDTAAIFGEYNLLLNEDGFDNEEHALLLGLKFYF